MIIGKIMMIQNSSSKAVSYTHLTTRSKKEGLNVATPKIGEIVDYSQIESYQEHWWENVE